MQLPRIYTDQALKENTIYELSIDSAHHISNVLRMRNGQKLILFNGEGGHYKAEIMEIEKKRVSVKLGKYYPVNLEPELNITLAQGVSRGHRMDIAIQKAVELGVKRIVPVISEYCAVHLKGNQLLNKYKHWNKIIIGACEQCGRNLVPQLEEASKMDEWLKNDNNQLKLILHPESGLPLTDRNKPVSNITLLIGPEGGFSENEYEMAMNNGYQGLKLGPRILRTETAAIAAISAIQTLWGDFS